ncbi:MAG: MFS transporter [Actinomycetota bacterium]|nr:MFS transporter [Actinomycetota bacterium]
MAVLRNPSLLALVAAQLVSGLGSQMTYLALPWFVLATTGSAAKMGIVLAVEMAPVALLGIPSGTVIARLGALQAMRVADLARAPLMASVPLLHALGVLGFPLLLVIVFAIGCFLAPFMASQRVVVAELVGDDPATLGQANAIVEGANRATSLLGPALAGVLIAAIGPTNLLYVDAATFLLAFLTLTLFVPRRPPVPATDESRGVFAGLRFLARDALLWRIGLTAVFLNMFGAGLALSLPVLAYEEYGGSSRVAGLFFACFGAGALLGTVLAMRLLPRFRPLRIAAVSIVAMMLPLWLLGVELPAWAVMAALVASAIPQPLVNAPILALIIGRAPEPLRPKVMTSLMTLAMLAGPLGLLAAGPLLERLGPRPVFLVIAAGMTFFALFFAWIAVRHGEPRARVGELVADPN